MASHRVHVHVHIGNRTVGRRAATAAAPSRGRSSRRTASRARSRSNRSSRGRYNTTTGSRPGSGSNFRALSNQLARRGAKNPGALAAYIGRQKYGKAGMARMAAAGRRRGGRGRRR